MNGKRITLIIVVTILGAALFLAGTVFAQSGWGDRDQDGVFGWGTGHMAGWGDGERYGEGYRGMMGNYGEMMDGYGHMTGGGFADMMGEYGATMGAPMMGGWGGLVDVEPLSIEDSEQAVAAFLAESDEEDNLAVGEIMIFANHAYAQVIDAASGEGAFEVLVDPQTRNVYPEPGPNMMWNTTYGHMSGGMMGGVTTHNGGMMNGYGAYDRAEAAGTVDEAEAVTLAQTYLNEFLPGAVADDHADAFPGYYTLHVVRDGQIVGMLSVNAVSGDVFPHTWHGDFIEMTEAHAD